MKPQLSVSEETSMDQPAHPYHRLYQKALGAVRDHEAGANGRSEDENKRLAAALVMSIKAKDRTAAYHLELSPDRKQVKYRTRRKLVVRKKKAQVVVEQAPGRCAGREDILPEPACEPWMSRSPSPCAESEDAPLGDMPLEDVPLRSSCELRIPGSSMRTDPPMAEAGHPDHQLYRQALAAMGDLDTKARRMPDVSAEKLAAALVMSARESGLSAIHRVSWAPADGQLCVEQHRWVSCFKWVPFLKWFPCFRKSVTVDIQQALDERLEADRPSPEAPQGAPNSLRTLEMPEPSRSFDPPMATAGHPDHELYQQALTKLMAEEGSHPGYKRFCEEWIKKISAALVASAREGGLKTIDRVAWGNDLTEGDGLIQIFAVQDGLFPCWRKTAQVYLGQVLEMSMEDVSRRCEAARESASPPPVLSREQQLRQARAIVR